MDSEILKVSSKSNPNSVAGAINQTIKAIAIARGFVAPTGIDLICIPAFSTVIIEEQDTTSMKFIVKGAK